MASRRLISCFLAFALGLASADTCGAEQSPVEAPAAILLGEDGTPRCRIGQASELDALRECDEGDILEGEQIGLGMAAPPMGAIAKTLLASAVIGGATGCVLGHVFANRPRFEKGAPPSFPKIVTIGTLKIILIMSAGFFASAAVSAKIIGGMFVPITSITPTISSMFPGTIICNALSKENFQ